jgi:N-acetylmuramic acid 6-phosphate etherase
MGRRRLPCDKPCAISKRRLRWRGQIMPRVKTKSAKVPAGSVRDGPLFLGIESGGTRTVALLVDDRGQGLQRFEAGPANLRLMNDEELTRHFRRLAGRFPQPSAVGIGMAGLHDETERVRLRTVAGLAWPRIPCWAGNDLETALAAATEGCPAGQAAQVIVISGTGSCCYGRAPSGATAKAGGWGHVLGDRGSGYDISLRTLRAVMQEFDASGRWPRLGRVVLRSLLLNTPSELVSWAQNTSKTELAALTREIFVAAKQGDRIAKGVVAEAAESLAQDAAACARRLVARGSRVEFHFTGSVLTHQPSFAATVKRRLRALWPKGSVRLLQREGPWGAVTYAIDAWLHSRSRPPTGLADATSASGRTPKPVPCPVPSTTGLSPTEQRNPRSMKLDRLPLGAAIRLMLSEDARIPAALRRESHTIEKIIRLLTRCLRQGGGLFYVGAGTSGRLGVLDASECPPTFRSPPEQVQGIMAGGQTALWSSVEGAEDDAEAGAEAIAHRGVTSRDLVVGIAASGRTPYVWGALQAARQRKAKTVLLCFNPYLKLGPGARPTVLLAPRVGPEILTGSTRLKAGTATKLLLNMFTTLSMVRLGKVVSNLMVDLNPSNTKLRDRAVRIVMELTGSRPGQAQAALERSGWRVKKASRLLGRKK